MSKQQTNIMLLIEFVFSCLLIYADKRFALALFGTGCVILAFSQIYTLWKNGGITAVILPTAALNKKLTESEMLPFKVGLTMVLAPFAMLLAHLGVMANNAL